MSDCDLFRTDLNAYRDDLLDEERKQQLRRHVLHCQHCSEEIRQLDLMETDIRIRAEQWVAPVDLWERVQSSVKSRNRRKPLLHTISHKPLSWVATAMLLVIVAFSVFNPVKWQLHPPGDQPPLAPAPLGSPQTPEPGTQTLRPGHVSAARVGPN